MVAGLFKRSGYFFGHKPWRPSKRFNAKGYFEEPDINRLNEHLLKNAGLRCPPGTKPPRIGQRWIQVLSNLNLVNASADDMVKIQTLLARSEPFCYKDPRFCYTLQIWRTALDERRPVFLCIVRNPLETAMSIERFCKGMWGMTVSIEQGLRAWCSMFRHILAEHRSNGEWLFLNFDGLLSDSVCRKTSLDAIDSSIPQMEKEML